MYSALGITSRPHRTSSADDEFTGTSKFSYSSEILEKRWELKPKDGRDD
jgi:hypothetical protein